MRRAKPIVAGALLTCLLPTHGQASGVSPYLPLNLAPEMEREIERLLILADKPVIVRPIPLATVLDAMPAACKVDEQLCRRVRRYLNRYSKTAGLGDASLEVAGSDGADVTRANARGASSDSAWQVSGHVYWQPSPYASVTLGGVAYEGDADPTGSVVSLGFQYAQLDIGYRDHWLSPFTQSSMLIGTQAPTMPSVTLSSYAPITALGLRYEVFLAEMDHSDRIRFGKGFTSGNPQLSGLHISMEPVPGWSIAANRIMQFGGGERGGRSFSDFWHALVDPGGYDSRSDVTQDEEFGNQAAAWSSRFIFPGSTPFAVYLQYAGEDRAYEGNYRFGNAALSVGISFPRLWHDFDLTYEASEWQNGWYAHSIYLDGLTNDRHVIGHWGADQRRFGNAVGAQAHVLMLGWEPGFGGLMQLRARTIDNGKYSSAGATAVNYDRGYDVSLAYSRGYGGYTVGAQIGAGRDVFGDSFSSIGAYMRFADEWEGSSSGWSGEATRPAGAELFVDAGINANRVRVTVDEFEPQLRTDTQISSHAGIGARRAVSRHNDLGVRLEVDRIQDAYLLGVRAVDYRYRFDGPIALSAFLGAARYDLGTPAYGYYGGVGITWRDILPRFDLSLEGRYADKISRDKVLADDPPFVTRNDIFYDISSATFYLSYRW